MQDESFGEVLLFPLIQLSKSFNFHSISHNQSHNNQTNNHNYLFNIAFQNLEFWDVTNLPPLKGISSSRFGEARKKQVRFGVFSKSIDCLRGSGVLPPLETSLRSHQYSYTPSLFLTGPVFSDLQDNSFSRLFQQWHNLSSILLSFHLGTVIPRLGLLS